LAAVNATAAFGPAQWFTAEERDPSVESGWGFRVTLTAYNDNRVLNCESNLESDVAAVLLARNDVCFIRSQWPTVAYVNENGELCRHTFDFYIEMTNGSRFVIAVRPEDTAQELRDMITLMKRQACELWTLADDAVVYTQNETDFGQAYNALCILRARRNRNGNEVETLRALVANAWGTFRFYDLLAGIEVPAHRRNAIWCLIDDGFFAPVTEGKITDHSLLCVTANWDLAA
jgi:hypothetical protein